MRITNESLLSQFDAWVKRITSKDIVALFHDADSDGISSGAITASALNRLRGRLPDIRLSPRQGTHMITEDDVIVLKKAGVTKFISCDVALDQTTVIELTNKIASFADVLIIDHHALYEPITKKNILLIKPQLFTDLAQPSKYCTSKLAYDLFSRITVLDDKDWLAAAGCISDIATEPWTDWIDSVFKKYKIPMHKDLFKTKLGEVGIYINDTASYDDQKIPEAYLIAVKATKPDDVLQSSITAYHEVIDAEIQKWTKGIVKNGEWHPELKLVFYEINPKYKVKSAITTIIGLKYTKEVVIVSAPENGQTAISMRCQKGVAVNKLLTEAIKGLENASGGGHIPAAGGRCNTKDYPAFKNNVMKLLREGFTGLA